MPSIPARTFPPCFTPAPISRAASVRIFPRPASISIPSAPASAVNGSKSPSPSRLPRRWKRLRRKRSPQPRKHSPRSRTKRPKARLPQTPKRLPTNSRKRRIISLRRTLKKPSLSPRIPMGSPNPPRRTWSSPATPTTSSPKRLPIHRSQIHLPTSKTTN